MTEEQHDATHGCRCVGAQCLRHRRQPEPAVAMLSENSSARKRPEQAPHRIRVGVDLECDLLGAARTVAQYIRDAELGRGVDRP
jgi:hypothetical protein